MSARAVQSSLQVLSNRSQQHAGRWLTLLVVGLLLLSNGCSDSTQSGNENASTALSTDPPVPEAKPLAELDVPEQDGADSGTNAGNSDASIADSSGDEDDGDDREIIKQLAKKYSGKFPQPDKDLGKVPDEAEILRQQELVAAKALAYSKELMSQGHHKRAKNYLSSIVNDLSHTEAAEEAKRLLDSL